MIAAPRHPAVPPTGPHRPDAVGLFAAMAAILALAAAAVGSCVCITGCASGAPSRKSDASPHVLVVGEEKTPPVTPSRDGQSFRTNGASVLIGRLLIVRREPYPPAFEVV